MERDFDSFVDKWGPMLALCFYNLSDEKIEEITADEREIDLFVSRLEEMSPYELIVTARKMGINRQGDILNTDVYPFKIPESLMKESKKNGKGRKWLMDRYREHLIESQKTSPKAWDGLLPTILIEGGIECDEDQHTVLFGVIVKYFNANDKPFFV